jgi:hypothetical protein
MSLGHFMRLNEVEMHGQMKLWRKSAKTGKVFMNDKNNIKVTASDGKVWHILVVQPCKEGDVHPDTGIDPCGLMVLGVMVSGNVYAYKSKENRDKVFSWVMKGTQIKHQAPIV